MKNQIILGDCLDVMISNIPAKTIDLCYIDPPYNSGKDWGEFDDRFSTMKNYVEYMTERVKVVWYLLKDTGSFYCHVDQTASHYLKVSFDDIFGIDNFINEIVWCYPPKGVAPNRGFPKKHDSILFYAKDCKRNVFNRQYLPYSEDYIRRHNSVDENGRRYYEMRGVRTYLEDKNGYQIPDWWIDIDVASKGNEFVKYPTQKPLKLLKRIIEVSTNKDEIVLDPFCGSGTTLVAADHLGRRYIGIDQNENAVEKAKKRLSLGGLFND